MSYTNTSFGNSNILSQVLANAAIALDVPSRLQGRGPAFIKNPEYSSGLQSSNAARNSIQSAFDSLVAPRRTFTIDSTEADTVPFEDVISRNGRTWTVRNADYGDERRVYDQARSTIENVQGHYPSADSQAEAITKGLLGNAHQARRLDERNKLQSAVKALMRKQRESQPAPVDDFSGYLDLNQMLELASGVQT